MVGDNPLLSLGDAADLPAGVIKPTKLPNTGAATGHLGQIKIADGAIPDANEMAAGYALRNRGFNVTFQATANSQKIQNVRTADMFVDGIGQVDIYTPSGVSQRTILNTIAQKDSQGNAVLIQSDLSNLDMESISNRTWGRPDASRLNVLIFKNAKGQVFIFTRPK